METPMSVSDDTCAIGGLINPDAFPVPDFDTDSLDYQAGRLRAYGVGLAQVGGDIKSSWAGLSECYSAPEAAELYSVVDPVAADGESVETGTETAAAALETFAQAVRDLKVEWIYLKSDANAFLSSIEGDDDWREGGWDGESEKVAEHNELLRRASVLVQDYQLAEMDCANAINAGLTGRSNFVYGGTESAPNDVPYGYGGNASGMDTPWGGPAETDHFWTMDVDHAVGDFLESGGDDLSAMLGFDPDQNRLDWSWDTMREAHWGNITSAASLVGLYDVENEDWGPTSRSQVAESWAQVAHSIVPWSEWDERPGYVIGTTALNLVTFIGAPLLGIRRTVGGSDADGSSGSGTEIELRVDIPFLGGSGTTLGSVNVNLPQLGNLLNASALTDAQNALDRLIDRNDETASGADSSNDPTVQDLYDGMTLENLLDSVEDDARRDGDLDDWVASPVGGDINGDEATREPALVGARSDTGEAEGTPEQPPNRPIDLTGNGDFGSESFTPESFDPDNFEVPGDWPDRYGADAGGLTPDVTNSVDGSRSQDSPIDWDAELGGGGTGGEQDSSIDWDAELGGGPPDGGFRGSGTDDRMPEPDPVEHRMRELEALLAEGLTENYPLGNRDAKRYGDELWEDAGPLTPEQVRAVNAYAEDAPKTPNSTMGPNNRTINAFVMERAGDLTPAQQRRVERTLAPLTPEQLRDLEETVAHLDEAMRALRLPEDVVVIRGVDDLARLPMHPSDMPRADGAISQLEYMSTSLGGLAPGFETTSDAILHLRVPAGTNALWVDGASGSNKAERELLLSHETQYRVIDAVQDADGTWHVYGEVVSPDGPPGHDGPDPDTMEPTRMEDGKKPFKIEFGHTDASGRWFDANGIAHIEPPATARDARIYDRIRADVGDTDRIAERTGVSVDVLDRIKEHIFMREHDVAVGPGEVRRGRFTPMTTIAEWWIQAQKGEIGSEELPAFRRWLAHESVESLLIEWGMPYLSSDPAAFPWDPTYESHSAHATADHYGAHDLAPAEGESYPWGHYREEWGDPSTTPDADLSNAEAIAREIFERFHQ
jgi:hypothetical protein